MSGQVNQTEPFDLEALPGFLIRRMQQVAAAIFAVRFEEGRVDLTPVQFAALNVVDERPGIDQASLAGMIACDRVTTGKVVDRLMQAGLIRREVSARDKRAREVYLLEAGREAVKKARPLVLEIQETILAGLTEAERRTFLKLLIKATDAGNAASRAPLVRPEG